MTSGIYLIRNRRTGKEYVGQSSEIERRWTEHRRLLDLGKHHCRPLQRAWRQSGADAFEFVILEGVEDVHQLNQREEHHFRARRPAYNTGVIPTTMRGVPDTRSPRERMMSRWWKIPRIEMPPHDRPHER